MKNSLILGDTGGIGAAVSAALAKRGGTVTGLSRTDGFDVTQPDTAERVLEGVTGPFDLIFVAIGVLGTPEKALAAIDAAGMAQVFAVNTFGVALILKHLPRLLVKDGRAGILTARVGSIGDNQIGGWHSYRASKAATNMLVRGTAIEMARSHKEAAVVALHPGTVETAFTADYRGRHAMMAAPKAAEKLLGVLMSKTPAETGRFYDYANQEVSW